MAKPAPIPDEVITKESSSMEAPGNHLSWWQRRDLFRAHLKQQPLAGISAEETEAHFSGMPAHYWERVNNHDLVWGLETIHGFLQLVATPNVPATTPFVSWRQVPQAGRTRIMLCTWDRHGLLAKAAAAFSGVRLNIVEADVFTRADNVVLDVFSIVDSHTRGTASQARLQEMTFLLDGALSEPHRFASDWACSGHKVMASPSPFPPRIVFDNKSPATSTLVHVEASDRLGLLYDILQTLADGGLNITQARIETDNEVAHDIIHVTDVHGQKIVDPSRLGELRCRLEGALMERIEPC